MVRIPAYLAVAVASLMAAAAPALADQTLSQVLPPGGSISTGGVVSPSDPVQMAITAPGGGAFAITKVTSPASRQQRSGCCQPEWVGPDFQVTFPPPGINPPPPVSVTFLIDPSVLPLPGNQNNGATTRDATAQICESSGNCFADSVNGETDTHGSVEANGDVLLVATGIQAFGPPVVFDVAHSPWHVEGGAYGQKEDLDKALKHGLTFGFGCTQACEHEDTAKVSAGVAHQLHLKSTTVGSGKSTFTSRNLNSIIHFSKAFARAMKHHKSVVLTIHSEITGTLGDKKTKSGRLTLKRSSELD
jgi:hypothetical protein